MNHVLRDGESMRRLLSVLSNLPIESKPFRVSIEEYHPERSNEQHNTFWMWCDFVAQTIRESTGRGCSRDEIHDIVLGEVYGWRHSELRPELVYPARTLTKPKRLTKLEMCDLLTAFDEYAARKGIVLPQPSYENAA